MKAYKCDVCGYYCNDVYKINSDVFDIFPSDKARYGVNEDSGTEIRDMCECCYRDIRDFIHNKHFNRLKERESIDK